MPTDPTQTTTDIDDLMIEVMSIQRGVPPEDTRRMVEDALRNDPMWARNTWAGWYRVAEFIRNRSEETHV